MLSCWHDLLFLFCLLLFYLFLPYMGWLCGVWGLWTDRVFSLTHTVNFGQGIQSHRGMLPSVNFTTDTYRDS